MIELDKLSLQQFLSGDSEIIPIMTSSEEDDGTATEETYPSVLPLLPLCFRFHGSAFIPVWIGKAKRAQPPIRSPFLRFYLTYLHGIFLLYAST